MTHPHARVGVRAQHVIETVEAAYALTGSDQRWLEDIVASAHRDLDLGAGTYGFTCRISATGLELGGAYAERGLDPRFAALIAELNRDAPPEVFQKIARTSVNCGGFAAFFGPTHPATLQFRRVAGPHGFVDGFSLLAQDGEGSAVDLSAPSPHEVRMHPRVAAIWRRVALHIASGWRLRRRLARGATTREALVDGSGKIHHAEAKLRTDRAARTALADAARRIARARGKERASPGTALELWQGLVAGRWSLVDHWESDGRRYLAAFRNRPEVRDPRALSPQERSIVRYVWLGASNKEIAFTLGLPHASVAAAVTSILRKLACERRAELVALGDPSTWERARVHETRSGELDVASVAVGPLHPRFADLTSAEKEVAQLVLVGDTNDAIARKRTTSANTVANQLQSIYRKLHVESRAELVRRLKTSD